MAAMGLSGRSVVIAVGDELLAGFTLDSNTHWLAKQLFAAGYPLRRVEVVADVVDEIAAAIRRALDDPGAERILVCGGVGPTTDDRTHEGVAAALGREIVVDPAALEHIGAVVARLHAAGRIPSPQVSEANRKMAHVPAGGIVLENRLGMAPPLAFELGEGRRLFVLPGVPRELQAIVEEELLPRFFTGSQAPVVVELHYTQVVEADFYEPMRTLEAEFPDVAVGSYPQQDRRELILRVKGADAARVEAAVERLEELRPGGLRGAAATRAATDGSSGR